MSAPKRIQRKRIKGYRLPPDAVYVGRPSKWGNPFRAETHPHLTAVQHVACYRWMAERVVWTDAIRAQLAGHDLACWCPLEDADGNRVPCHADVLLEIANGAGTR